MFCERLYTICAYSCTFININFSVVLINLISATPFYTENPNWLDISIAISINLQPSQDSLQIMIARLLSRIVN